jgi:hypothetical protein
MAGRPNIGNAADTVKKKAFSTSQIVLSQAVAGFVHQGGFHMMLTAMMDGVSYCYVTTIYDI